MTAMVAVKLSSGKVLELTELEFNEIKAYFNIGTWTSPFSQPIGPWLGYPPGITVTYSTATSEK